MILTWFDSLYTVKSFYNRGHLIDVYHAIVIHVVKTEGPLQLVLIWVGGGIVCRIWIQTKLKKNCGYWKGGLGRAKLGC